MEKSVLFSNVAVPVYHSISSDSLYSTGPVFPQEVSTQVSSGKKTYLIPIYLYRRRPVSEGGGRTTSMTVSRHWTANCSGLCTASRTDGVGLHKRKRSRSQRQTRQGVIAIPRSSRTAVVLRQRPVAL